MFLALYCSGQRVHVRRKAERINPKNLAVVQVPLQWVLGGLILDRTLAQTQKLRVLQQHPYAQR